MPLRGAGVKRPASAGFVTNAPDTESRPRRGPRALADTRTNVNQVSRSPSAARICGPVRIRDPPVPITRARTTRGDTPRLTTFTPRYRPGAPRAESRLRAEKVAVQ